MLIPLCLCVLCPSFIQCMYSCWVEVSVSKILSDLCVVGAGGFTGEIWSRLSGLAGGGGPVQRNDWGMSVSSLYCQPVSQSSHRHSIVTCDRFHMMSLSNVAGITWCHCHNTCITRCFLSTLNKMYRFLHNLEATLAIIMYIIWLLPVNRKIWKII